MCDTVRVEIKMIKNLTSYHPICLLKYDNRRVERGGQGHSPLEILNCSKLEWH